MDARAVSVEDRWDTFIQPLAQAIYSGETGFKGVSFWLLQVLDSGAWREFDIGRAEPVRPASFEAFLTKAPREGLGFTVKLVTQLVADHPKAAEALDKALKRRTGRPLKPSESVDVINTFNRPTGTSQPAAIRRLRKDRPDLLDRVVAGELSPHAAAIEAGFRRRTITVPLEVEAAARTLARHFSADDLARVRDLL